MTGFLETRAVQWAHEDATIAWCVDIEKHADRIEAVAQFPPRGVSALADEVFDRIGRGEVTGASIGCWRPMDAEVRQGAVTEIPTWELREWSFCVSPGQPKARVIRAGAPGGAAWDDPTNPREPTFGEAGGTSAHYQYALRRYESLKAGAPYYRN